MATVASVANAPLEAAYPALRLASLVGELAAGLRNPADVWRDNGVTTRADAEMISALPVFRQMLVEARQAWGSRESLSLRVKAKAGALVEDSLPFLHASVISPVQPLSQRVAAFTALAKMAGVEQPPETRAGGLGGGAAGGVAISISMDLGGGNVVGVQVGGEVVDVAAEDSDGGFLLNPEDYLIGDDDTDHDASEESE
jgi:hypothetical protein